MHYPGYFFTVYQAMQPKALFALFNFPQLPLTGPFQGVSALASSHFGSICCATPLVSKETVRAENRDKHISSLITFIMHLVRNVLKGPFAQ